MYAPAMTTLQISTLRLIIVLFLLLCAHAMARNLRMDAQEYHRGKLSKKIEINVEDYGAVPDGKTEATEAFQDAWNAACRGSYSSSTVTIVVPGKYFLKEVSFRGPCTHGLPITVLIEGGTLLAPSSYIRGNKWIEFKSVDKLTIRGGTFDGQGQSLWKCKAKNGKGCPVGATSLSFSKTNDLKLDQVTLVNSERFHTTVHNSNYVTIIGMTISAPADSPNTDGIHFEFSNYVNISGAEISTGDDCISLSHQSKHFSMQHINCDAGHGVSIGSLGEDPKMDEGLVYNITGTDMKFKRTTNGLRIKTWATQSKGSVKLISFSDVTMEEVKYPIIIQQDYCDEFNIRKQCPRKHSSQIAISQVSYSDVKGTSTQHLGVVFICSESKPCTGITLHDIDLYYKKANSDKLEETVAECQNARGTSSGIMHPPSCLE